MSTRSPYFLPKRPARCMFFNLIDLQLCPVVAQSPSHKTMVLYIVHKIQVSLFHSNIFRHIFGCEYLAKIGDHFF